MLTFALDMEIKKTPQADMEQRRATGFLLGLILVLAVFYVALEWNSTESAGDGIDPIDLTDLMHETELVPMSNEEFITQLEEKQLSEKGEQLNIVDDETELQEEEVQTSEEVNQAISTVTGDGAPTAVVAAPVVARHRSGTRHSGSCLRAVRCE